MTIIVWEEYKDHKTGKDCKDIIELFDTVKEFKEWLNKELKNREKGLLEDGIGLDNDKLLNPFTIDEAPFSLAWETFADMTEYKLEVN